jgi:CRISPR-associated protein Csm5
MSLLRFRAVALTPIHIGSGETIAPEDYLIQGDRLIRFNPHAVLRDMSVGERRAYEQRLERNDFQAAQEILRKACNVKKHARYTAALGGVARGELTDLIARPNRRCEVHFEVHLLQRNPYDGSVVLPGSSLKGAIRTAVINACAQRDPRVLEAVRQPQDRKRKWRVLEEESLGFRMKDTQSDPLRLLKVADARIPADQIQVDRARLVKRGALDRSAGRIQMYFERLLARSDGGPAKPFDVAIEFLDEHLRHPKVSALFRCDISWDFVREACLSFYRRRMEAEMNHFFGTDERVEARYGVASLLKKEEQGKGIKDRGFLLRVGRFSHFESLSVDGVREGWNAQKKRSITGMGATRTLCASMNGKDVPFGWLLLMPLEAA